MSWKDDKIKEWNSFKSIYSHVPTPPSAMVGKLLLEFNLDENLVIKHCDKEYELDSHEAFLLGDDDWSNYWKEVKEETLKYMIDDIISNP